jgi:hypothetical protein
LIFFKIKIPDGVGTSGTVTPDDGRPPIKGVWVPPPSPKCQDEFVRKITFKTLNKLKINENKKIPYDEPTGGLPRLKGKFTPDNNMGSPVQVTIGPPCRAGGPPTIVVFNISFLHIFRVNFNLIYYFRENDHHQICHQLDNVHQEIYLQPKNNVHQHQLCHQ